jgi:hypothetical protein
MEPMTDAERRRRGRELDEWRRALPVARDVLAREEDDLEEQRGRYDRVIAEKQTVGAEIVRRQFEENDPWHSGRDQWSRLSEAEGKALVATSAAEARVSGRRRAIASLEQFVRERARELSVMLEPDEVPPPPEAPPQVPGDVERTMAWRHEQVRQGLLAPDALAARPLPPSPARSAR